MAIIRSKQDRNYTVVNNKIFETGHLAWDSRGLLCTLLSKPDEWRVIVKALEAETKGTRKETGERGIREMLDELMAKGYVIRKKQRSGAMDYFVFDTPQNQNHFEDNDNGEETANCSNSKQPKEQTAETANCSNSKQPKKQPLINTDSLNKELKKKESNEYTAPDSANVCDEISETVLPEKKPAKRKNQKQADVDFLIENGFDPELAKEWVDVRHAKGAKIITPRALKTFLSEVEKAKMELNHVLEMCISKCWVSFEARWIFNRMGLNFGNSAKQNNNFVPTTREVKTAQTDMTGSYDENGNLIDFSQVEFDYGGERF